MSELWLIILGILLGYGLLGVFVFVFSYVLSDKLGGVREVSLMVAVICLACFTLIIVARTMHSQTFQRNNEHLIGSIHCIEGFEYVQRDKDRFDPLWEIIDGEAMPKVCE